ncbi:hypothetical protein N784_11150 [Pontibacillus litoralis JSM 072002]|uniref:Uncharacterized protein n=1 Tax=Pontibacillus litoralis JSM 072002 TaxID=1385512 RepID=A0A0A5FZ37_9BACI|nr:hypothetical protein N784_11150 [Pontibacillus litoralis JSM 072002]
MFTYNRAERYVFKLLKSIAIQKPNDLSINNVSKAIGIQVIYWEFSSESAQKGGKCKMFLKTRDSPQEQWQEFTHELCQRTPKTPWSETF